MHISIILFLFFLSGTSTLIFETLWQRMLILVFGASATATTAILTAFFLGIAFGSFLGAKLSSRFRNALFFYGSIELGIALWGLAVPTLLSLADHLYISIFQTVDRETFFAPLTRFVLSVLVVLPATIGMGATIPAMNRLLSENGFGVGKSVGLAYGINTLGAVFGTLACGFYLIQALGVQHTLYVAVGINILVVAVTFGLGLSRSEKIGPSPISSAFGEFLSPRGLVSIYFFSGFVALGFEIVWFRILAIHSINSTSSFALFLATYLLGLSTGSFILFPWLSTRINSLSLFTLSNFGVGLAALSVVPLFYHFPEIRKILIGKYLSAGEFGLKGLFAPEALFSFIMIYFPTVFMGLAFPSLCHSLISLKEKIGKSSGTIFFIGTLGSTVGVLCVGLFIIPLLGLVKTFALLCTISLFLSLLTLLLNRKRTIQFRPVFFWSSFLFIGIAAYYAIYGLPFIPDGHLVRQNGDLQMVLPDGRKSNRTYIRYKEGPTATVMVSEDKVHGQPKRGIFVDGIMVASTRDGARTDAKMLAHLPLLLHSGPKSALTVGFGSGGTSWSMTLHDIEVDCVEIEPEVSRSAHLFTSQNKNVLKHPKFNLVINDARDHLRLTHKKYDVISTDVTTLQYKQNGSLYTKEYFSLMKSSLAKNGIAAAWVPMAAVTTIEFKILLKTFSQVFPHTTLWYMNQSYTAFAILIGTPQPLKIDLDRLSRGFSNPLIKEDLNEIGINHPFQFVHFLLQDEKGVHQFVEDVPIHTDNYPILEFTSPYSYYTIIPLLVENLRESIKLRPKNYLPYVASLDSDQQEEFNRYNKSSEIWTKVLLKYYEYTIQKDRELKYEIINEAVQLSTKALELVPNNSHGIKLSNDLKVDLKYMEMKR